MKTYEEQVEVVSVGRATSVLEGKPIFQVIFGKMGTPAAGLQTPMPVPSVPVAAFFLVVYVPEATRYQIGTRWRIRVAPSGEITVKPLPD